MTAQSSYAQVRSSQSCLAKHEHSRLLTTVAQVANLLLRSPDYQTVLPEVMRLLGEAVGSDRASLVQNVPDPQTGKAAVQLHTQWCCAEVPTSTESIPELESALLWEYFPDFETQLAQGEAMHVQAADVAEPALSLIQALSNVSITMVPIIVNDRFWGVFSFDYCREAKRLDEAEQTIFTIAADSVAAAIERDQTQKAILQAEQARSRELNHLNTKLQQTLTQLSESEKRFRTLFELSSEGFYCVEVDPPCPVTIPFSEQCDWLHQNIRVVKANPAFAAMYGVENPDELIGLGSTDVHVADSEKNAAFIPTIVKHGYRCHNLETEEIDFRGQQHYFLNSAVCTISEGHITGGWASQLDITELRQAREDLAEESLRAETALIRERTRIAQEIHDTLAQTFTGISVQLKLAQYLVKQTQISDNDCDLTQFTSILERVGSLAQTGLDEARRSVWSIYPVTETQNSLPQDLADHVKQVTNSVSIRTQVTVTGSPQPLSYFVSRNLLRLCQEALTNVLKHANAATLEISLTYRPQQVSLQIYDDGCGFSPQFKTEGFGLVGMSERVDQINGQLRIASQPGEGTEIFVEVPL
ncbi:GAF domain-containing sensor histidine kinase [cf. Phormidesmis sp. LEGE 11477]|uniref:GAF domain-containing sensor histidine kinase n=1 Tax=cf. Phormidesmis sp. LEGE 11477 TaxID=1828680 RepID=UPI0018816A61|nr:ATP-binding protein [cf. Phormidesmis sp. LEGE 11477]MBE9064605.1 GAF domain-containing protein [cf. Phormidesmis sp. LEGE 11477]